MSRSEDKEGVVAVLREALNGRTDVRLAMLFGSRARGRGHGGSDVDLAVEAEDGSVVHQGQRNALGAWRSQAINRVEFDRVLFERRRDGFLAKLATEYG